jgi:diguanylate cyclase (GGDEF)-like protein/PAS domain S-box-containing protein
MNRLSVAGSWRPGLRALVLSVSTLLIVGTALAVSLTVSDHLAQTAVAESVRVTEAVVRGYVDLSVPTGGFANLTSEQDATINAELSRLVAAGKILRIKVWSPNGTVVLSDLPALRGRQFAVGPELGEALQGNVATDFSNGTDAENIFERGLADRFLSIYLPIRAPGSTVVVGAYEIYEDAGPIEAAVATTRGDVLLIVGAMALGLLALLFAAFSGASRLLTRQNRRLREQALTEQLLAADLRRSQERFRSLVQNSADVNMVVRADGTIDYESPAVERVLGYRVEDRVGRSALDVVHPDDRAWAEQLLADVLRSPGAQLAGEFRVRHADGSWRSIEAVAKNLLDDPAVGGVVVNYRDITMRKALEEELRHQAFHDALTGLANRALFADRLGHALARTRRARQRLAVLFVDLDDFKNVNDSLGHGEGDHLLVAVAERLQGALRAGDTIARMGGDEFAVLVEDPAEAGSPLDVAERLLSALQAPFERGGKELFVHASVGVAISTSTKQTADELLRNADVSMYTAKSNGKNRIEVFEPAMHTAALARLALKGDLERGLERAEFFLLYQPVMDLAARDMVGVEALVRWRHPERGLVGPSEFIPLAEETGLIVPLGRWVLEQACRQATSWDDVVGVRPLTMNVNVSGRQVTERGFVDEVARVLAVSGLDPGRLVLEFTEGVLMENTEATRVTLSDLKRLGVRLAIDDFGTGYSSLSYLRLFPIDVLKIDRSFVASMSVGPDQRALVRSILKLSETLHLETVAEGIEEADQLAVLQTLGADLGQGFFFAEPISPEAIAALLATRDGHIDGASVKANVA